MWHNRKGSWSQYYRGQTLDFGTPYDFGSIMHYNPISRVNIDPDTYSILALEHEYQNTMGQRVGHSFKDIKLLNRLYCTIDYPFTSSLSKSINFGCETKEYELNGGKCKNGGYPDPLKNCACRCPEGHGGRYCTEYKYENCKAVELTAKVKKQAISTTDFSCLYVVKAKQANDKIKAKRILINVETILFQCNHPCQDNYIEIKYLKDKSATGARICCNLKIMPLTITAEASTDVLIMRKGFGAYVISYQIELAPHKESSSCKEIRESIFDPEYHKLMVFIILEIGVLKIRIQIHNVDMLDVTTAWKLKVPINQIGIGRIQKVNLY